MKLLLVASLCLTSLLNSASVWANEPQEVLSSENVAVGLSESETSSNLDDANNVLEHSDALAKEQENIELSAQPVVKPKIAIVIDDLGDNSIIAKQMLSLPVQMTAAILPHTPHAKSISNFATVKGHHVIMHLPMESFTRTDLLGPGALLANMPKEELQHTMIDSAASVPHIVGFNNHMGSLLTEDPQKMRWVMESAKRNGWFFLDSKTSDSSVAQSIASELGLANIGRDLFLDHQGQSPALAVQFARMQKIAKRRGQVVVICHPYPQTLAFLREHINELSEDFELVGLGSLFPQAQPPVEPPAVQLSVSR